jgi:hypothetical protein
MSFRIQLRRDTASNWTVNNPILLQGEQGYETNTGKMKIGDGVTPWNNLSYWVTGQSGTTGPTGPANLSVTDGSQTVTGVTSLVFSGGGVGVSGSGSTATITISSDLSSIYNSVVRYVIDNTIVNTMASNEKVTIMSSGNVYANRTWSRSGTTLTINSVAHGLSVGDGVLVRNTTVADNYIYGVVQTTVSNSFTINVANSGNTSGTAATYIPSFAVKNWSSGVSLTLAAPNAGNCQIMSCSITSLMSGNTLSVRVDGVSSNGGGDNSGLYLMNPPTSSAANLANGNNISSGVAVNTSSNFNTFTVTSLSSGVYNTIRLTF